jgi:hypothetical protein
MERLDITPVPVKRLAIIAGEQLGHLRPGGSARAGYAIVGAVCAVPHFHDRKSSSSAPAGELLFRS